MGAFAGGGARRLPVVLNGAGAEPSGPLRHVAFKVDDVRGVVDRAAAEKRSERSSGQESTFLLCYVRGPEGLIVELAEWLDSAPG